MELPEGETVLELVALDEAESEGLTVAESDEDAVIEAEVDVEAVNDTEAVAVLVAELEVDAVLVLEGDADLELVAVRVADLVVDLVLVGVADTRYTWQSTKPLGQVCVPGIKPRHSKLLGVLCIQTVSIFPSISTIPFSPMHCVATQFSAL